MSRIIKNMNLVFNGLCFFFSNPRKVMWLTFILGVIFSIIVNIFLIGYNSDAALTYIPMTHAFSICDWNRAFFDLIPPLFTAIAGSLSMILGVGALTSMLIVSSALSVFAIFPLYGLLSFFMEKKYAAWGALFYIITPKILRFGFSPMLEGSRSFFFILPIFLIFSFIKDRKLIKLVYIGISFGLLSLIRGEGILSAIFTLVALVILCFRDNGYRINLKFISNIVIYCLVIGAVMMVVISPRMYQNYLNTGYPTLDGRQSDFLKSYFHKPSERNQATAIAQDQHLSQETSAQESNYGYFSLSHVSKFLSVFVRGSYELYFALSVLGIFFIIYRREWNLNYSLLIMLVLLNAVIFYLIALTYRYFLVNILLMMPFTIMGYRQIVDFSAKFRFEKFLMIWVLIIAIFQIINGMGNCYGSSDSLPWEKTGQFLLKNESEFTKGKDTPTAYILGVDLGLNLFEHFNIVSPTNGFRKEGLTLNEVMKGFPAKKCTSTVRLTPNNKWLKPNVIIANVRDCTPEAIDLLKSQSTLREIPTGLSNNILIFKVNK